MVLWVFGKRQVTLTAEEPLKTVSEFVLRFLPLIFLGLDHSHPTCSTGRKATHLIASRGPLLRVIRDSIYSY